jgi:hypothetical protein
MPVTGTGMAEDKIIISSESYILRPVAPTLRICPLLHNLGERKNPVVPSPSAHFIRREYALLLIFVIVFSLLD